MSHSTAIVGFDSAWTDNPKAPGAICILRIGPDGRLTLTPPVLASFAQAEAAIRAEQAISDKVFIAIDQPTIVHNQSGMRDVDKVAASLISFVGGGVQPANRGKRGMFDDDAPIWRFKTALAPNDDVLAARAAQSGLFMAEVFPAMALLSFEPKFCVRRGGPRYNPARKKTFTMDHWTSAVQTTQKTLSTLTAGQPSLDLALKPLQTGDYPKKALQDQLDAVICALIGYFFLFRPELTLAFGSTASGLIVTPAIGEARARLIAAAAARNVPIL